MNETEKRIEEIRARFNKTTPGKWDYDESEGEFGSEHCNPKNNMVHYSPLITVGVDKKELTGMDEDFYYVEISEEDAVFVAESHQDIPFLLAEVDRLNKELEAAKSEIRKGCDNCKHWQPKADNLCAKGGCEGLLKRENWEWRGLTNK